MVEFCLAQTPDLARIVEIYNQIIPTRLATADLTPVTVDQKKDWFASFTATHPLWMIKQEAKIVGWIGLEPFYGRPAYEHTAEVAIYIDSHYHHQGLGKQAVTFVLEQAPRLGLTALVAYIFGHNLPSQKLFAHFGFKPWGHLPGVAVLDGQERDLDILGYRFVNTD